MNKEHPITPPPELVQQWHCEENGFFAEHIATQAARWGADQELEECWRWMRDEGYRETAQLLHAARRPQPPSLKEQALTALSHLLSGSAQTLDTTEAEFYIRRALEALPA